MMPVHLCVPGPQEWPALPWNTNESQRGTGHSKNKPGADAGEDGSEVFPGRKTQAPQNLLERPEIFGFVLRVAGPAGEGRWAPLERVAGPAGERGGRPRWGR